MHVATNTLVRKRKLNSVGVAKVVYCIEPNTIQYHILKKLINETCGVYDYIPTNDAQSFFYFRPVRSATTRTYYFNLHARVSLTTISTIIIFVCTQT